MLCTLDEVFPSCFNLPASDQGGEGADETQSVRPSTFGRGRLLDSMGTCSTAGMTMEPFSLIIVFFKHLRVISNRRL